MIDKERNSTAAIYYETLMYVLSTIHPSNERFLTFYFIPFIKVFTLSFAFFSNMDQTCDFNNSSLIDVVC